MEKKDNPSICFGERWPSPLSGLRPWRQLQLPVQPLTFPLQDSWSHQTALTRLLVSFECSLLQEGKVILFLKKTATPFFLCRHKPQHSACVDTKPEGMQQWPPLKYLGGLSVSGTPVESLQAWQSQRFFSMACFFYQVSFWVDCNYSLWSVCNFPSTADQAEECLVHRSSLYMQQPPQQRRCVARPPLGHLDSIETHKYRALCVKTRVVCLFVCLFSKC